MDPYKSPESQASPEPEKLNRSVIKCPECDKPLVNIGSRVERIHPIPKFIQNHHSMVLFVSYILSTAFFLSGIMGYDRFIGFALVSTYLFIPFVLFMIVRLFDLYRITDCPYCGFHEKQNLGRVNTP